MYVPYTERYAAMAYRRCGKSGLKLPEVSLGLWHNFGDTNTLEHMEAICKADDNEGLFGMTQPNKTKNPKVLWTKNVKIQR